MAVALAAACSSGAPSVDSAVDASAGNDGGAEAAPPDPDAGTLPDAGRGDAGVPDAGGSVDAGASDTGADAGEPDAGGTDGGIVLGAPIAATANTWTFVSFPDSSCNDGSPVGIGINPSATSSNVLIYLNGGGACWDYLTCYVVASATLGPYTSTQFKADIAGLAATFDRTDSLNPFADWNYVFVP